jgi:enoyl-[acyl-carrier protein] reductase I
MAGLFKGKCGVIMGIANHHSIAAGIAKFLIDEGADLAFSYLPDETGKMEGRIRKVVDEWQPKLVLPCNVNNDDDIVRFFNDVATQYGRIDFIVHSIAFAPIADLKCPTIEASRQGFLSAMDVSVYSFLATCREGSKIMNPRGSILTLSYFGGERVVAGYNMMGLAKAALEMSVRYAAYDLGSQNIRVNAISAGPIKTLASSAVGAGKMLDMYKSIAPLERNVTQEEVGKSAGYLLSDLASAVTGEILHVDAGYHVMGSPGRAFEKSPD